MSPLTGKPYSLRLVCEVWRVARSSVYALRDRLKGQEVPIPKKRGPKTELSDEDLIAAIEQVLKDAKSWARGTGRYGPV